MRRVRTGRLAGLSGALCLVTGLLAPATVLADPPVTSSESTISLECPVIVTPDGAATAFAFSSDLGFGDAFVAFWPEEPPPDEEVLPALEGFTDAVEVEGLTLSAHFFVFGEEGSGEATLNATLTPEGEPIPFSSKSKHFREEGTTQTATIEGSLVIDAPEVLGPDPVTFDLATCQGFLLQVEFRQVIPGTFQDFHDEMVLSCTLEADGATAFLNGFAVIFEGEFAFGFLGLDLSIEGQPPIVGGADAVLTASGVEAEFGLGDPETGDERGTASVTAAFTPGEVLRGVRVAQNYRQKMLVTRMQVDGSLIAETDAGTFAFDMSACDADLLAFHNIFHTPEGPKAGGRVPGNDTPEGAVTLEVGDRHRQFTGGASIAAEEPCLLDFGGELIENSWGRTVWFAIEGTGEQITIDPSKSDFDTSIAAYVDTDGGLEQVACIDDDLSSVFLPTQAPLTIDTVIGETYYIQVGGFDEGSLFEEPPRPEYGHLRIRVR